MFPYFGSKRRSAGRYPEPLYHTVIEPFAGACAYSMHFKPVRLIACDLDERVVEIWHRIMSLQEIPAPPTLGSRTSDLMHMAMTYSEHASTSRYMSVTKRMLRDWDSVHRRAMEAQPYLWRACSFVHGHYQSIPMVEATWFVDPPYQHANRRGYRERAIDFAALGDWCRSLPGQVIVCEQEGADWLPFRPLHSVRTHRGSVSREVIWESEPT
jgi:hypothetical protein